MPFPTSRSTFDAYREGSTTLEVSTLIKMVLLVRGFRGKLDEQLRKINQTTARMETLSAILRMSGKKSQSEVSASLGVEGATITRMIDILGMEGLVERVPHPTDRRINLLRITPAGEAEVKKIFRTYDKMRDHLLADMSQADIEVLNELLTRMLDRLDLPMKEKVHIADMPAYDRLRDKLVQDSDTDPPAKTGDSEG